MNSDNSAKIVKILGKVGKYDYNLGISLKNQKKMG